MPSIYIIRSTVSAPFCGPGSHNLLRLTQGSGAQDFALDSTGDTWSFEPVIVEAKGFIFAPGTWSARLVLKNNGFNADVRCVVAIYDAPSGCAVLTNIIDETKTVSSASYATHVFAVTDVGLIHVAADQLLLCIVYETSGSATMQYHQSGPFSVSAIVVPAEIDERPREYYRRNQRRRAH